MNKIKHKLMSYRWITSLALLSLLSGCASSLTVKGDFPIPVVNRMPISMGLNYGENFKNFTYQEQNKNRSEWTISTGDAQVDVFSKVLGSMFRDVSEVSGTQNVGTDLVLTPVVEDFQYTLPKETKVKMYEVWLKYNIQVHDAQGQLIADWILTSYGKSPAEFIKTDENALNDALVMALRDAGARLAIGFIRVPEIRSWLQQRKQKQSQDVASI